MVIELKNQFYILYEMDSWLEKFVKNKNIKPEDTDVKIN